MYGRQHPLPRQQHPAATTARYTTPAATTDAVPPLSAEVAFQYDRVVGDQETAERKEEERKKRAMRKAIKDQEAATAADVTTATTTAALPPPPGRDCLSCLSRISLFRSCCAVLAD